MARPGGAGVGRAGRRTASSRRPVRKSAGAVSAFDDRADEIGGRDFLVVAQEERAGGGFPPVEGEDDQIDQTISVSFIWHYFNNLPEGQGRIEGDVVLIEDDDGAGVSVMAATDVIEGEILIAEKAGTPGLLIRAARVSRGSSRIAGGDPPPAFSPRR